MLESFVTERTTKKLSFLKYKYSREIDTRHNTLQTDPQSIAEWMSSTFLLETVLSLHYHFYCVCRNSPICHAENVWCKCKKDMLVVPRVYTRAFYICKLINRG